MAEPNISVVIPCRNERDFIISCIHSVLSNDYPSEKMEVIVCDGMSSDGTTELLRTFVLDNPSVKILQNEKQITPHALNLGIKHSTGEIIFILGAHAEMEQNYIRTCVEILDQKKEVWCCGGVLKNDTKDETSKVISLAMTSPFGVGSAHFRTGQSKGYVDTAAFGAYRKEVFSLIGWFDEELARNQDDEFNFRLIKQGKKIWLTTSTSIKYFVRGSWKKLWNQYFQYGYWKVFVNKKHKTVTSFRQLVPFFFVLFLITGFVLSILIPEISIAFLSVLLLYIIMSLSFAIKSVQNLSALKLMYAFWILHISYGWGYLLGFIDFFLLGKLSSGQKQELTR